MPLKKSRINSKGMDTSAIMGFMNSLMDVIKEKPDHLAVAFDNGGSQLRNESFQNIKHRDATPEAIKLLFLIYKHY
jgi:DNA polymerase-1